MRPLIIALVIISCFASCKSFQLSSIPEGNALTEKLPMLVPELDIQSFQTDYEDIYGLPEQILTGTIDVDQAVRNATTMMIISEDTKYLFEREFIRNISQRTGKSVGYAVCRKGFRTKGIKSFVHPLVSIITLSIPNFFGFKYATLVDELELVVDIYDNNDNLVGSFSALGKGEADIRMYKGYRKRGARRLAHGLAFNRALDEIKNQIKSEYKSLNLALLE